MEKEKRVVKNEPSIVLICPNCGVECFDIRVIEKEDGTFLVDDICWRCDCQLP
jgi:formylmethanofuran dehydrogenase subunit B